MLENSSILITGGAGSFGYPFVPMTIEKYNPKRLVILSRDEIKQGHMAKLVGDDPLVHFLIGDAQDKELLYFALGGIDYVVHPAETKIVPIAEYNPFECIKTNIDGAMNLFGTEDSYSAYAYPDHFKIIPQINSWANDAARIKNGVKVPEGFVCASDCNPFWMSDVDLQAWLTANQVAIRKV